MSKRITWILACSVLGSIFSFNVQAFPVSSAPEQVTATDVVPVRGLCGLGFHRSAYGYCVRNGTPYVYPPPPVYAPPVYAPPAVYYAPRACAYGYHLGPYGRCYPY
jgi:hypothetical protein